MEIDLKVSDLLLPPYTNSKAVYETTINDNKVAYQVRFRLPTGGDQEETVSVVRTDLDAAVDLLVNRCVERVTIENGRIAEVHPRSIVDHLSRVMFELDPQAEMKLDLACPYCNQSCSAFLDASTFFSQEVTAASKHLFKEVHVLAYYYHWSENEILGMTTTRRHRYLALLDEELKGPAS
jgi:hypothetical protein